MTRSNNHPAEHPQRRIAQLPAFVADYAPPDEALVPRLLAETADDPATDTAIAARARRYIDGIREARGGIGGLEDFMHEYSLSTPEGLALMSLAEALLRVPDAATQDRLIEDKLGAGDWEHAAARESESWLVSRHHLGARPDRPHRASAGDAGGDHPKTRAAARPADRAHRRAPGDAAARPSVRARRDDRGCAVARARTRGGRAIAIPSTCWARARAPRATPSATLQSYAHAIEAIGKSADGALPGRPGISVKLSALHPRYVARQRERVLAELTPRLIELASPPRRMT